MIPIVTDVPVVASGSLGAYRVLTFRDHAIAAGCRPGQFVNIATGELLRRPFSVYRVDRHTGDVSIAFDAIGPGTHQLAARAEGDRVDVVGPLGHGFEVPEPDGSSDLLVGGGYGSAALAFLADELAARGRTVHAILGARSADRVFRDELLERACASITVTTNDGTAGERALVTDVMPRVMSEHGIGTVYACGPMAMLRAVGAVAGSLRCQLAVEEFMACGIGVCWTCVLAVRADGTTKHLRSCTEGPVFEASAVAWA